MTHIYLYLGLRLTTANAPAQLVVPAGMEIVEVRGPTRQLFGANDVLLNYETWEFFAGDIGGMLDTEPGSVLLQHGAGGFSPHDLSAALAYVGALAGLAGQGVVSVHVITDLDYLPAVGGGAAWVPRRPVQPAAPRNGLAGASFLVGHGTFLKESDGFTRVPHGTTLAFASQAGRSLAGGAGLAALTAASLDAYFEADETTGDIANYRFGPHSAREVDDDVKCLNSLNGNAEKIIVLGTRPAGAQLPPNVSFSGQSTNLCTTPTVCMHQYEGHSCDGILGKHVGTIMILACLAEGDNPSEVTTRPAYDRDGELEVMESAEEFAGRVHRDWQAGTMTDEAALAALESYGLSTGALLRNSWGGGFTVSVCANASVTIRRTGILAYLRESYVRLGTAERQTVWSHPPLANRLTRIGLKQDSRVAVCPCAAARVSKVETLDQGWEGAVCASCHADLGENSPLTVHAHLNEGRQDLRDHCVTHAGACPQDEVEDEVASLKKLADLTGVLGRFGSPSDDDTDTDSDADDSDTEHGTDDEDGDEDDAGTEKAG
ncbi:hypothetical protein [Kitasatospora mediocidica]|uniref:hypothetical protein n=1 Tax=Kitasatospora mediocidica TaxID=58352 RepID=UPI0005678323|nr:hypothetical protein [Kitasatospora mediocidica]